MTIPVVDLQDWYSNEPSRRAKFVRTMGEGLETYGFFALKGHDTPDGLLGRCYATASRTFALPMAVKQRYETPGDGRQRGYTGLGVEHAKDQPMADLKEFWHVGREPESGQSSLPANQFPSEEAAFRKDFEQLFANQDRIAGALLDAIGVFLGWPEEQLRNMVHHGNSVLRVIHYPPVGAVVPKGAVRAAQHEDINLITVLPVSTEPGLELLTLDGEWMAVNPPQGVMVCDTGDMMHRLTGGRLRSTTHRVVNPSAGSQGARYSMPFFCHPHPDALLPTEDGSSQVRAADFLHQRLVENGVAD